MSTNTRISDILTGWYSRRAGRYIALAIFVALTWAVAAHALPSGLPFGIVLLGILLGSLNALTAIGLVLVYRAARIVNFAQADIGGLAAAVAVILVAGERLPYFAALPLGLATALATGFLIDATVIRRFFRAPRLILTVATIGVAQILGAGEVGLPSLFTHLAPLSTFTTPFSLQFTVGPVVFNGNAVVAFVVVPLVMIGLWWFLTRTHSGIAIRAAADSEERAVLLGIPARKLSRAVWMVAAGLSGVGAMLSAPILGPNLGAVAGPTALLAPLAAAVIAGMESMPIAGLAAIGLGVFQQAVLWSYPQSSTVDVALFGFILLAVVLRKRSMGRSTRDQLFSNLFADRSRAVPRVLRKLPEVRLAAVAGLVAVAAVVALVPIGMSAPHLTLLTSLVIYAIVAISLTVLAGWAGQISLGQFAFVGIGAAVTGALLVHAHADLFVALLAATGAGALGAVLIGVPALRVPGLFLAVVTLAFAVPVSTWLLDGTYFPALTPSVIGRPILFGRINLASPLALYELCLIILALAIVLAYSFRRSRAGRSVLAVRDNDRAASAYGMAPWRAKLVAFTFSGMLAGIAGGLYAVNLRGLSYAGFDPEKSVVVFTMVVVGGLGSLPGALLGAIYVQGAEYFLTGAAQLLATGTGVLVLLLVLPGGLGEILTRVRDRFLVTVARARSISVPALDRERDPTSLLEAQQVLEAPQYSQQPSTDDLTTAPLRIGFESETQPAALACTGIDSGYGDLQVLFGATMKIEDGTVLALLGTNGAGKSTLLRVLAGTLPAKAGKVLYFGKDITRMPPEERVKAGLVTMPGGHGVFSTLTVAENLRMAGWLIRRQADIVSARIQAALDLFPSLRSRLDSQAGLLSGGEQQMLALAQCLICDPKVLMVDELSLGLAPAVVGELIGVLRNLAASGTTVVVVEQSLNVAAAIAPEAVFMERGQVRFTGASRDLLDRDDLARAVFLGVHEAPPANHVTSNHATSNGAMSGGAAPDRSQSNGAMSGGITWQAPLSDGTAQNGSTNGRHPAPISIQHLSVRFGGIAAISDVTISAHPGEILGIIGANGAGKTTLFDVCSGFLAPTSGRIMLWGTDVISTSAHERANLGLGRLFQDARLFPGLTVAEALAVSFDRHLAVREPIASTLRLGDARDSEAELAQRVDELIARLGLEPYRDSFIAELSTGTRRIVELAGVLAHRPTVLLADEPSSGVAQREVEAMADLLRDVRQESDSTLLIIEHDIPMISQIADRLICMHLGEVLAEGSPSEVLGDPRVVAAYLGTEEAALARSY